MRIKQPIFTGLVFCILLSFVCCHQTNPNISQKILSDQVQNDTLVDKMSLKGFNFETDTSRTHLKQKVTRSIPSGHSPIVVDISKTPDIERDVMLSQFGNRISYIKFKPKDSLFFVKTPSYFQFYENHIIVHNLAGIAIFDQNGYHIDNIVTNDINVTSSSKLHYGVAGYQFKGAFNKPVIHNNQLYYLYADFEHFKYALTRFDLGKVDYLINQNQSELKSMAKGQPLMTVIGHYLNGIDKLEVLDDSTWIGFNSFWNAGTEGELYHSFTMEGDTIATFKNYDPIYNYYGGTYRRVEQMSHYRLGNKIRYRQALNDTLYSIAGSNQMIPEFVFDRGDKKANLLQTMNPKTDLYGKIFIEQFLETKKWFIIILKNNHSSPNNKKKGTIKFSCLFFNKETNELIKKPGDFINEDITITNDLDNGCDFWPTQTTKDGWLLSSIAVKWLKEEYSIEELKKLYPFDTFHDEELILTIVK